MLKNKKIKEDIINIIWIFIIVSFLGFLWETSLYFLKYKVLIRKNGLLFSPLSQVYGIGGIIYYLVLIKIWKNKKGVFIISTLLGATTEFFLSFFQELIFGTTSWNYSKYFLNIQGRTSLLHAIAWGIIGVLFVKYIYPLCLKIIKYLSKISIKWITYIVVLFLIFDISISFVAAIRYKERRKNISPSNFIETQVDKYFPDKFMDKAYPHSEFAK